MAIGIAFHILAATIWIGGLYFVAMVLRPSIEGIDTAMRLALWHDVLSRFFPLAWLSIVVLLGSGVAMVLFGFGGFAFVDRYVRIMAGAGLLTVAVFSYLYLAPWRTFSRAVEAANWEVAGKVIGRLRVLVAVSLILGALTVVVGASGRYLG